MQMFRATSMGRPNPSNPVRDGKPRHHFFPLILNPALLRNPNLNRNLNPGFLCVLLPPRDAREKRITIKIRIMIMITKKSKIEIERKSKEQKTNSPSATTLPSYGREVVLGAAVCETGTGSVPRHRLQRGR